MIGNVVLKALGSPAIAMLVSLNGRLDLGLVASSYMEDVGVMQTGLIVCGSASKRAKMDVYGKDKGVCGGVK